MPYLRSIIHMHVTDSTWKLNHILNSSIIFSIFCKILLVSLSYFLINCCRLEIHLRDWSMIVPVPAKEGLMLRTAHENSIIFWIHLSFFQYSVKSFQFLSLIFWSTAADLRFTPLRHQGIFNLLKIENDVNILTNWIPPFHCCKFFFITSGPATLQPAHSIIITSFEKTCCWEKSWKSIRNLY